jgi:hypothetical protein
LVDGVQIVTEIFVSRAQGFNGTLALAKETWECLPLKAMVGRAEVDADSHLTLSNGLMALVDTGAAPNIVTKSACEKAGAWIEKTPNLSLRMADNSPLPVLGKVKDFPIHFGNLYFTFDTLVVEDLGGDDIVLGRDFLRKYDVLVDIPNKQIEVRNPDLAYTVVTKVSERTPFSSIAAIATDTTYLPPAEIEPVEYEVQLSRNNLEIIGSSWLAIVRRDGSTALQRLGIAASVSLCVVKEGRTTIPLLNCNQAGERNAPNQGVCKLSPMA